MPDDTISPMPPFPDPVPAANARSPHRKPRSKRVIKDWLRHAEKETFIRVYVLDGWAMACKSVNRSKSWVYDNSTRDISFMTQLAEAKKLRKQVQDGMLDDLTAAALNVICTALKSKGDPKLSLDAAKAHLRGVGIYSDKHEISGPGGQPIETVQRVVDA